ncbi:alpha-N-arabinofuranosidase [Brachybacterium sp. P6-10-X1]|nr:alpha-N-arabinofuranosidase [Brachybacterium sp. P6-10-X1]
MPEAHVRIDTRRPLGTVSDDIYGHFLESAFFGNITGGVFDEGSELSLDGPGHLDGMRSDVLDLVKELRPGAIRWPGGNFTSAYHWEDGIGPRDQRPARRELAWGEIETNRYGTDEFLAWCEAVGADAYLAHSARDIDEAVRWVDYTNGAGETTMARARRANGREDPWRVRYWGVGNEVYGPWQMGHRSAERYAEDAAEHARFMRAVDPGIELVGVGIPWDQERWTTPLLAKAGRFLDHLSLHHYGASNHLITGDDYDDVVAQSLFFEREISRYSQLITDLSARLGLDRVPQLVIDEWNMRHLEPASWPEPRAGADGGIAERDTPAVEGLPQHTRVSRYSPRTLGDAVFSAGVFQAIHRSVGDASAVTMANPVNLLNANGIVVARPEGAFGSTLYHVWHLYRHHTGRTVLPVTVDGPARSTNVRLGDSRDPEGNQPTAPMTVPYLDVVATRADDGSIRLAVVNRHRSQSIRLRPVLDDSADATPTRARIRSLGGDVTDLNASNSLSAPATVAVRDLGDVAADGGAWVLPPHSVSVLILAGAGT